MKTRVYSETELIPDKLWDSVVCKRSMTLSHAFLKVVEESELNNFSYRYLVTYDDSETPLGSLTAYVVTTDIAIFAPPFLREFLKKIRRWAPNFLKWRMLECGTPININSTPWTSLEVNSKDLVRDELLNAAFKLAKQERVLVTVFRDFDSSTIPERERMKSLGFAIVDGLPNTILDLRWHSMNDYLRSMKSYYRSKLLKHVRHCELAGMTYEITDSFSELAEMLCRQWLVVHANAQEYQREVLTPDFYRGLSNSSSIDARVVLIYRDGFVVAHALVLFDGQLARWMYFGREAVANDGLYLFAAYAVIETAINAGMSSLELGVTNYQTKLDLGVRMVPLKFAIGLWSNKLNRIAGLVYNFLNKLPTHTERDVFKESAN